MSEIITLNMAASSVQHLCKKDKHLSKVISMVGPITYMTPADNPHAFLVHKIIEQMLSIKAGAITAGTLYLVSLSKRSGKDVIKELTSTKGIGIWTSKMYLIFVLNRNDVLPIEDIAFLQSYKWMYKTEDISKESILKNAKNGSHIHQ